MKDPASKPGVFAIIKDNIGKDLSRISMPVFFNEPLSLTQKSCASLEYRNILDLMNMAEGKQDLEAYRIALVAIYGSTQYTCQEKQVFIFMQERFMGGFVCCRHCIHAIYEQ